MYEDLVGNKVEVGDNCYFLKTYTTSVHVGIVKIIELSDKGAKCVVVKPNPTRDQYRGVYWNEGYITKPLALTNMIKINE